MCGLEAVFGLRVLAANVVVSRLPKIRCLGRARFLAALTAHYSLTGWEALTASDWLEALELY